MRVGSVRADAHGNHNGRRTARTQVCDSGKDGVNKETTQLKCGLVFVEMETNVTISILSRNCLRAADICPPFSTRSNAAQRSSFRVELKYAQCERFQRVGRRRVPRQPERALCHRPTCQEAVRTKADDRVGAHREETVEHSEPGLWACDRAAAHPPLTVETNGEVVIVGLDGHFEERPLAVDAGLRV